MDFERPAAPFTYGSGHALEDIGRWVEVTLVKEEQDGTWVPVHFFPKHLSSWE
jgi:hypothetical protein